MYLPSRSGRTPIKEAITQGEFARGEAALVMGKSVSVAREILSQILATGLLTSPSEKGAIRIGLPIEALDTYFPSLFPAT